MIEKLTLEECKDFINEATTAFMNSWNLAAITGNDMLLTIYDDGNGYSIFSQVNKLVKVQILYVGTTATGNFISEEQRLERFRNVVKEISIAGVKGIYQDMVKNGRENPNSYFNHLRLYPLTPDEHFSVIYHSS